MIPSNTGPVSAEFSQEKDGVADWSDQSPMPQQDVVTSHDHQMHPQKFVQLVGCHDAKAGKHQAPGRPH
jgi:hypothetical protein